MPTLSHSEENGRAFNAVRLQKRHLQGEVTGRSKTKKKNIKTLVYDAPEFLEFN